MREDSQNPSSVCAQKNRGVVSARRFVNVELPMRARKSGSLAGANEKRKRLFSSKHVQRTLSRSKVKPRCHRPRCGWRDALQVGML